LSSLPLAFGQATVGNPFPSLRFSAVIPSTTGMAKLVVIAFPAGKQTSLAESALAPDVLAKVLQHESTPLQSVAAVQTAPSAFPCFIPHASLPYSLQTSPSFPC